MEMTLSEETAALIRERMQQDGYRSADDVVRAALELLEQRVELDAETLAAIDRGEAQIKRGEVRDWSEVRAEVRKKLLGE